MSSFGKGTTQGNPLGQCVFITSAICYTSAERKKESFIASKYMILLTSRGISLAKTSAQSSVRQEDLMLRSQRGGVELRGMFDICNQIITL